ncbi:LacI family DNA-binding transcriptional regulator [Dactylosporangium sp. NPDC051541]|uniref:LacI family DNA-binding transcriptional regulator n=1 Tax=Dactylosporangium sp. NPDC051541 TaxID=3363977 RepID=UPI0037BD28FA
MTASTFGRTPWPTWPPGSAATPAEPFGPDPARRTEGVGKVCPVYEGARRGPVTPHDVSREAGVSYATASRAINGSARRVRGRTRSGWGPRRCGWATRRIRPRRRSPGWTRTVALVTSDVDNLYFSSIACGAVDAAKQRPHRHRPDRPGNTPPTSAPPTSASA